MKLFRKKFIILLIIILICIPSYAKINNIYLRKQKITSELNLVDIKLGDALLIINEITNINFIADNDVKNIILDIDFPKNENMETLINVLCEIYDLSIHSVGNSYLLTKKSKTIKGSSIYGNISSNGLLLDGVKISLINSNIPSTFSYDGKYILTNIEPGVYIMRFEKSNYKTFDKLVNVEKNTTNIDINLVRNNNFKRKKANKFNNSKEIIRENNLITKKIILNGNNVKEIRDILLENFATSLTVSMIEKQNILILTGDKMSILNAQALINELDNDLKQIQISSQILDISNNLFENLGFNWIYNQNTNNISKENNTNIAILDIASLSGIGSVYSSSVDLSRKFNSGNDILNLGINMLESTQDLVVSARPTILVINGEEGSFKVTEEIIVGEKKYENDKNDKTTTTPIFKEAGIILKVIPYIKENDIIILDTLIEVSNFKLHYSKNNIDSGTMNSEGGSKISREIKTKIKVKNGQTIFIGGLKRAIVRNLNSHIPIFGTLPMIKYFFKNDNISHEMSDIYIKLKVDIVNDNIIDNFEKDEIHKKVNEIKNNRIF